MTDIKYTFEFIIDDEKEVDSHRLEDALERYYETKFVKITYLSQVKHTEVTEETLEKQIVEPEIDLDQWKERVQCILENYHNLFENKELNHRLKEEGLLEFYIQEIIDKLKWMGVKNIEELLQ